MEGGESHPPPLNLRVGEREGNSLFRPPPSVEKSASPPPIEALMSDLSLFEEPLLKDLDKKVISSLGSVYGKEVMKKEYDLPRDSTPFQMAASISILLYLCWSFLFSILDTATAADKHFLHLYDKIL